MVDNPASGRRTMAKQEPRPRPRLRAQAERRSAEARGRGRERPQRRARRAPGLVSGGAAPACAGRHDPRRFADINAREHAVRVQRSRSQSLMHWAGGGLPARRGSRRNSAPRRGPFIAGVRLSFTRRRSAAGAVHTEKRRKHSAANAHGMSVCFRGFLPLKCLAGGGCCQRVGPQDEICAYGAVPLRKRMPGPRAYPNARSSQATCPYVAHHPHAFQVSAAPIGVPCTMFSILVIPPHTVDGNICSARPARGTPCAGPRRPPRRPGLARRPRRTTGPERQRSACWRACNTGNRNSGCHSPALLPLARIASKRRAVALPAIAAADGCGSPQSMRTNSVSHRRRFPARWQPSRQRSGTASRMGPPFNSSIFIQNTSLQTGRTMCPDWRFGSLPQQA